MKNVSRWTRRLFREELGVTGMETAIILIAFVVVASVFAFAVLSTGLFTSDKSKETIQAGLSRSRNSLEIKGNVRVAATNTAATGVTAVTNTGAALVAGATSGFLPKAPLISGTEIVRYAGVVKVRGVHYNIDYDTGQLTFLTALVAADLPVTADFTWYRVDSITVPLALATGGEAVDLTGGVTIISYTDANTISNNITDFTLTKLGNADSDSLLEPGEIMEVTIVTCVDRTSPADSECLDQTVATQFGPAQAIADLSYGLTNYDVFKISIRAPTGSVLTVERTVPSNITPVMDLG